jgi:MoxR-like ATPase
MGTYLEINFMEAIWQFLTSRGAIYFYIIFILLSVVVIVVLVMRNEVRRQALMENNHVQTVAKPVSEAEPLSDEPRFFMLTQIDREVEAGKRHFYEDDVSLQKLCEEFREFSASRLGLYYDIADVRRFIGGLAVSHIMILQGMSGTGKTSLAYAFGEYLDNSAVIVPIQPMWKERTDLIGYYNEFTRKFNETTLLQKLYEANTNDNIYITVLDEMNIARVEYYFAEFLSLLEIPDYRKRYLDVVADIWDTDPKLLKNGQLLLPTNMWFVGTANNDDSTFAISDKVYDRAMVINLDRKAKPFIASETNTRRISAGRFRMLIKEAQKKYALSQRNLRRIRQLDRYLIEHFQITFGNRIMQQIRNYVPVIVACGGSELSAIDDILAKKVLRKLEAKNLVYVRSAAPGLVAYLDELFGEDRMALCKEYVHNIEKNV